MSENPNALPVEVAVTIGGATLKLPVQYGTAIREKDGDVWDHDALWYPGDAGTPDAAWLIAQEQYEAHPDEPDSHLVLVWRFVSDADDWIAFPDHVNRTHEGENQ